MKKYMLMLIIATLLMIISVVLIMGEQAYFVGWITAIIAGTVNGLAIKTED